MNGGLGVVGEGDWGYFVGIVGWDGGGGGGFVGCVCGVGKWG